MDGDGFEGTARDPAESAVAPAGGNRRRPVVVPRIAPPDAAERLPPQMLVPDSVVSEPLREAMSATTSRSDILGVLIQLRPTRAEGVRRARDKVSKSIYDITDGREGFAEGGGSGGSDGSEGQPQPSSSPYLTAGLTVAEIRQLVEWDSGSSEPSGTVVQEQVSGPSHPAPRRFIHRLWPNFEIGGLIVRSAVATKCRAVQRTFEATGEGIVWAVLDSGIQADHRHFKLHRNLELPSGIEHQSFIDSSDPRVDLNGHGTHVAGIIAGGLAPEQEATGVGWFVDAAGVGQRQRMDVRGISGMAPTCKLLSCSVLREDRTGDVTALLDALLYIQDLNDNGRHLVVHGVNISVGHSWDPRWFAAGLSPLCREVDRLVASGVGVVVAAGNTGYGYAKDPNGQPMRLGFGMTINDPGNSSRAITVGSTSSSPHTSGVSYFSSKGPTGDGRRKPDLVAPGERVISAAAGKLREGAQLSGPEVDYVESSGTSMAAPHVAGAAAGLLSVHREFIGKPDRVKDVLTASATDLGRDYHFQGAGMLDAMRAIQTL